MKADLALLTDSRYLVPVAPDGDWYLGNILCEDQLLQAALAQLGVSTRRVAWSDPDVDWRDFRCAVFRTTWDYFDRFAEFSAWFDGVQSLTRLCNPPALVRWNLDKHYLADLTARGVPAVRSRFVERGSELRLADLLDTTGWREAVLKPCVSGAARHTYRLDGEHAAELRRVEQIARELLADESLILQPFEPSVMESGEDSLMVFGGRYTHAVRKTPKAGDFRVQDDHGGTVRSYEPTTEQIELAEQAMAACDPRPAYGRVDMIRDSLGYWTVMELELVEPELWLRQHPPAATAMARAIVAAL